MPQNFLNPKNKISRKFETESDGSYLRTSPNIKNNTGFSTLEIMIALTIMVIVLAGAVSANFAAQYWSITSETSGEALYKAKTKLENYRALAKQDFYQATSSPMLSDLCVPGQLCYFTHSIVTDASSCSKYAQANISWQVDGYPTTTTALFTNLTNVPETINLGGDCLLAEPAGDWKNSAPQSVGALSFSPGKVATGIDVFHKKIYVTASAFPAFTIYDAPTSIGTNPTPRGTLDISVSGLNRKLNAIDVAEDLATGRTYAYVAVNATSSQLAVIEVTDPANPVVVKQKTLNNVDPLGTSPEGWRIAVYGSRLYMTTRYTAGNEFHIFNISAPAAPVEIGNGFQLQRTVNDFTVSERKISGVAHRLVFLASSAGQKEIAVLNVTNDTVSEPIKFDIPGGKDAKSIFLLGNILYLGRQKDLFGPELYAFDASNPTVSLPIITTAEVDTTVAKLQVSGKYLFAGTSKAGEEFQVWTTDFSKWNPAVLNAGRLQKSDLPHLTPLGFDIDGNWAYAVSKSAANDSLKIFYAP